MDRIAKQAQLQTELMSDAGEPVNFIENFHNAKLRNSLGYWSMRFSLVKIFLYTSFG